MHYGVASRDETVESGEGHGEASERSGSRHGEVPEPKAMPKPLAKQRSRKIAMETALDMAEAIGNSGASRIATTADSSLNSTETNYFLSRVPMAAVFGISPVPREPLALGDCHWDQLGAGIGAESIVVKNCRNLSNCIPTVTDPCDRRSLQRLLRNLQNLLVNVPSGRPGLWLEAAEQTKAWLADERSQYHFDEPETEGGSTGSEGGEEKNLDDDPEQGHDDDAAGGRGNGGSGSGGAGGDELPQQVAGRRSSSAAASSAADGAADGAATSSGSGTTRAADCSSRTTFPGKRSSWVFSMSLWSNTSYEGPSKNEWYEGEGKFTFPNGVVYVGQFRKGEFHGQGALVYPNGGRYQATWERGYAVEGRYVFNDGLLYEDRNWQYVSQGDRRFYTEVKEGLKPAGETLLTNEKVPPPIPKGTYDYGLQGIVSLKPRHHAMAECWRPMGRLCLRLCLACLCFALRSFVLPRCNDRFPKTRRPVALRSPRLRGDADGAALARWQCFAKIYCINLDDRNMKAKLGAEELEEILVIELKGPADAGAALERWPPPWLDATTEDLVYGGELSAEAVQRLFLPNQQKVWRSSLSEFEGDERSQFLVVEDDCEFVPYFDEEQVQRRLDEASVQRISRNHGLCAREALKVCFPLSWQLDTMLTMHSRLCDPPLWVSEDMQLSYTVKPMSYILWPPLAVQNKRDFRTDVQKDEHPEFLRSNSYEVAPEVLRRPPQRQELVGEDLEARYALVGSWDDWLTFHPFHFSDGPVLAAEVDVPPGAPVEFQVLRDNDWNQRSSVHGDLVMGCHGD
eukprot:s1603_g2.t1